MKKNIIVAITILTFLLGALIYCFMNSLIIWRGIFALKYEQRIVQECAEQKKQITLFFYKNKSIRKEIETAVFTKDMQENCVIIINRWLSVLLDEGLISTRITVQAASYDISGKKLLLSFDQTILNHADPVFKKLMTIEMLLKTIRENISQVQEVYLLVNHNPLKDEHIDTVLAWPINGFTHLS